MEENLYYSGLHALSQQLHDRKITSAVVVEACLQRIAALNPSLNAFITVIAAGARQQALVADDEIKSGRWRGPLHGVPVGIKDFYDTAGIKTTAAFRYFEQRVPKKDASVVARLKEAGAIIIGKTNMHQLGMGTTGLEGAYGAAANPWNASYIPGGSSSGSAAAVASGLCYATVDTDAVGSCRLPAACCGVTGFKGTYDLINLQGILEGEQPPDEAIVWLAHAGITTRSVLDTALVLNALAERNDRTRHTDFAALSAARKLRVGVAANMPVDEQVRAAFDSAVEVIGTFGHTLRAVEAPLGDLAGGIKNIVADRKAIAQRAFGDIDVLLLPTTTAPTPLVTEAKSNPQALSPALTAFANYYGLPAVSVPCGGDARGLPVGLQIVGKSWDDATVLALAHQYQQATVYDQQHPLE